MKAKRVLPLLLIGSLMTGCAAPIVVGGAATAGYMAAQERGGMVALSDLDVKAHVKGRLTDMHYTYLTDIGVSVLQGEVLLVGIVDSEDTKRQIGEEIHKIDGVVRLYNEIMVAGGYNTTQRSRDFWIASKLKARMLGAKDVAAINYMTHVVDANVYVMGLSRTQAELERVLYIARTTSGVRKVFNFIKIPTDPLRLIDKQPASALPEGVSDEESLAPQSEQTE